MAKQAKGKSSPQGMTKSAAARIQSAAAKSNGGTPSGSFAARAQRAASKNGK